VACAGQLVQELARSVCLRWRCVPE
jgi:hypothetical protein